MKTLYNNFKISLSVSWKVFKRMWFLSNKMQARYFNWHIGYGWSENDLRIVWGELHQAHINYAEKLNNKYHMKVVDPGSGIRPIKKKQGKSRK